MSLLEESKTKKIRDSVGLKKIKTIRAMLPKFDEDSPEVYVDVPILIRYITTRMLDIK